MTAGGRSVVLVLWQTFFFGAVVCSVLLSWYGDAISISHLHGAPLAKRQPVCYLPICLSARQILLIPAAPVEKKNTKMQQTSDLGLGIIGADGTGMVVCGENNFPVLTLNFTPRAPQAHRASIWAAGGSPAKTNVTTGL